MSAQRWRLAYAVVLVAVAALLGLGSPAWAVGEAKIDHAETEDRVLRVLYSLPELPSGVEPDLGSLRVTVNGEPVEATAELAAAADTDERVRRTAVMAIDTSNSMRGERFEQAKAAAKAFLAAAPEDVRIGIVAFAGSVEVVQPPTLDREAAAAVIDDLSLSLETRLYDGVVAAVEAAGDDGQRSLLVLSDGRDTSDTQLDEVVAAIADAQVRVDVVALGTEVTEANEPLAAMARQGDGTVLAATEPEALTALFNDEAAALARQILVTARLPDGLAVTEGSLGVAIDAGEETYSDTAFVALQAARGPTPAEAAGPKPVVTGPLAVSDSLLMAAMAAIALGTLVILAIALGAVGRARNDHVQSHIAAYTRHGAPGRTAAGQPHPGDPAKSVAQSAVLIAEKALEGNKGFEAKLAGRLDAADVALKPAEWVLIHAGTAVAAALLGFLVSSGGLLVTLLLLLAGALVPWIFLGMKKTRRLKAFNSQLPETLQLIAGSLSAGLSLAQALDTVVREGSDPIAGEFRRALVEARLGVQVEESLDTIARRMESADFEWVVMAIRIQREVGGNLAELLLKVSGTMREREYLRRQVKTLSAEGKLSGWILSALPPAMLAYMLVTNPSYLNPMLTTPLGWFMLGAAAVLMVVGAFWMSRVVKVDV